MATGQLTNAKKNVWECYFDASDPSVDFTDGLYYTNLVIKQKSMIALSSVKFFQDLSAAPPGILINIGINTTSLCGVLTPFASNPYVWGNTTSAGVYTELNPNNEFVWIQLTGITGSGITALSFAIMIEENQSDL